MINILNVLSDDLIKCFSDELKIKIFLDCLDGRQVKFDPKLMSINEDQIKMKVGEYYLTESGKVFHETENESSEPLIDHVNSILCNKSYNIFGSYMNRSHIDPSERVVIAVTNDKLYKLERGVASIIHENFLKVTPKSIIEKDKIIELDINCNKVQTVELNYPIIKIIKNENDTVYAINSIKQLIIINDRHNYPENKIIQTVKRADKSSNLITILDYLDVVKIISNNNIVFITETSSIFIYNEVAADALTGLTGLIMSNILNESRKSIFVDEYIIEVKFNQILISNFSYASFVCSYDNEIHYISDKVNIIKFDHPVLKIDKNDIPETFFVLLHNGDLYMVNNENIKLMETDVNNFKCYDNDLYCINNDNLLITINSNEQLSPLAEKLIRSPSLELMEGMMLSLLSGSFREIGSLIESTDDYDRKVFDSRVKKFIIYMDNQFILTFDGDLYIRQTKRYEFMEKFKHIIENMDDLQVSNNLNDVNSNDVTIVDDENYPLYKLNYKVKSIKKCNNTIYLNILD